MTTTKQYFTELAARSFVDGVMAHVRPALEAHGYESDHGEFLSMGAGVMTKREGETLFTALIPLTALRPQMYLEATAKDLHKQVRIPLTDADSLVPRTSEAISYDIERGEDALRSALAEPSAPSARFTEPVSDEVIKRISEEAIELAIERHSLLAWNEDGEGLTRDEIEEIKQDVVEVMTGKRSRETPNAEPELYPNIRL